MTYRLFVTLAKAGGAALLALAAGCSIADISGGRERLVGSYALRQVNGRSMPVDLGPIEFREPNPSSPCHVLITSGELTLDASGRFEYGYATTESCTNAPYNQSAISGTFTRRDSVLVLTADFGRVGMATYEGRVRSKAVAVIQQDGLVLEFSRR